MGIKIKNKKKMRKMRCESYRSALLKREKREKEDEVEKEK